MKNLILISIIAIISIGIWSCVKETPNSTGSQLTSAPNIPAENRWRIYTACWDEWGHGSGCGGWGLCNFEDCWGWQDPCCGESAVGSGPIEYDNLAGGYVLTITLTNNSVEERDAIRNQLPLQVDQDIIRSSFDNTYTYVKIPAGSYSYKSGLGTLGGYKVPVYYY